MATTTPVWSDPRVERGFATQLARRDELLAAGAEPVGWKVGFSPAPVRESLGISAPLIGFLNADTRLPDGAEVAVGDWTKPVFEAEIAIHISSPVPAGAEPAAVAACIGGLGAAIEIADIDLPATEQLQEVLAADIYHRGYILGPPVAERAGGEMSGIGGRVYRDGEEVARQGDPAAMVGEMVAVTAHVADLLAHFDRTLAAGEVIISGSVVPPLEVGPGQSLRCDLDHLGALEISFTE